MKIYWYRNSKNLIGHRLHDLRISQHLTQRQLAARMQLAGMEMNEVTILRIEKGVRFVPDYEVAELAKALAEFLFDDERAMVRIDMSEYSEKHSVARLVGAPPGYVGYEQGGQLTEAVRRRPYSVVLLDEVEKADPEIFDILLQVLDDGRLTDGQGRTVDFRNTILILTSNLGSQFLSDPDLTPEGKRESVMSVVRSAFRPEFLNRLDETVMFDALTRENLGEIVDLLVASLESRLRERRIGLTVTEPARGWLARVGYDPAFGARPLRRLIQREIGDRLAVLLLGGDVQDGQNVTVDINDSIDGLVMNVDKP